MILYINTLSDNYSKEAHTNLKVVTIYVCKNTEFLSDKLKLSDAFIELNICPASNNKINFSLIVQDPKFW